MINYSRFISFFFLGKNLWFGVSIWIKYYGEHYCLKGRKVFTLKFSLLVLWIMDLMHAYPRIRCHTKCLTATENIMGCKCSRSFLFFASIFMWDICFYALSLFLLLLFFRCQCSLHASSMKCNVLLIRNNDMSKIFSPWAFVFVLVRLLNLPNVYQRNYNFWPRRL